jgi:hypothetical protein
MEIGALTAAHVALMSWLTTLLLRPGRMGLYAICAGWLGLDAVGALSLDLPVRLWLIGRVPHWIERHWLNGLGASTLLAGSSPTFAIAGGSLGAVLAAWAMARARSGFSAQRTRDLYPD